MKIFYALNGRMSDGLRVFFNIFKPHGFALQLLTKVDNYNIIYTQIVIINFYSISCIKNIYFLTLT